MELENMGLFDKVNQVSRSVSESSKSAAETSNLKKKIAYEKERIQEVMTEIGRLFYENPNGDHKAELLQIQQILADGAGQTLPQNLEILEHFLLRQCQKRLL